MPSFVYIQPEINQMGGTKKKGGRKGKSKKGRGAQEGEGFKDFQRKIERFGRDADKALKKYRPASLIKRAIAGTEAEGALKQQAPWAAKALDYGVQHGYGKSQRGRGQVIVA